MEFSRQEYWSGLPFPSPGLQCLVNANYRVLICHFQSGSLFAYFGFLCLQVFSVSNFHPDTRGQRNTASKHHWRVWGAHSVWTTLGLPRSWQRVLSRSTLLRLQVALQGNCPKWALGCMPFPGLRCSGSGSWVLQKGADSAGPAFCALPRL